MPVKPYEEAVKKVKIKMKDMDKLTIVEKVFHPYRIRLILTHVKCRFARWFVNILFCREF